MAKVTKKDKRRVLILSLLILVMVAYLGYFAFDYWGRILDNRRARSELEKQYTKLLEDEIELNSEVIKLHDPEYVAKFAREKYMYSREGELIIRIAD